MLRVSMLGIAVSGLISAVLWSGVLSPVGVASAPVRVASATECESQDDPCVRVYKNVEDVKSQSYSVVKFTEVEVTKALIDNPRRVHDKIKDETGFDCKKGEYKEGYFRCEEGALVTHHPNLIQVLEMLYK